MRILITILFAFIAACAGAQVVTTKQSVKTIIQQRNIYLNGGARSSVGGKSRINIKIDLPPNTVSWYYEFTTQPGEGGTATLNLALQLSSLMADPSGITKAVASQINVPPGSASADVYLLDQKNVDLFMQKADQNGGSFTYYREGNALNTRQGVIEIDEITTGTHYIGIINPSMWDGLNVFVEVVAIVKEIEARTESQQQAITFGSLGWKAFERGDYDRCMELSRKALGLDATLGFVQFNIALTYLIKGMNSEALEEYTRAITLTRQSSVPKETFKGAIADLKTYMDKFPSQADAKDILDLLKDEIRQY
jgi:tetratricopeptide (TPR) repeat protein